MVLPSDLLCIAGIAPRERPLTRRRKSGICPPHVHASCPPPPFAPPFGGGSAYADALTRNNPQKT
jgi:hypothetical protein